MNKASLSVILTLYKRPYYFREQLLAIESQSVKPENIILFINNPEILRYIQPEISKKNVELIVSSENTYFHGRFAMALCMKTKYTCIFDDDTIPGFRWFENCLNTINNREAILGASGITFTDLKYYPYHKTGSNGQKNLNAEKVDFVGHSWFLKTDTLKYLWYERPANYRNAEDMALSYTALKYGGIETFVPPHPENDLTLYGSLKPYYGQDQHASYLQNREDYFREREQILKKYVRNGWQTVNKLV